MGSSISIKLMQCSYVYTICVHVCVLVGHCLATRGVWLIIGQANDGRGSWANKIVARTYM